MKRFIKILLFYFRAVGIKNTLFIELPEFIRQSKEDDISLIDFMEECMDYYID